jgi:hypothetical protein
VEEPVVVAAVETQALALARAAQADCQAVVVVVVAAVHQEHQGRVVLAAAA